MKEGEVWGESLMLLSLGYKRRNYNLLDRIHPIQSFNSSFFGVAEFRYEKLDGRDAVPPYGSWELGE
jgi:hypothetical protein